jgi:hypothetical protein
MKSLFLKRDDSSNLIRETHCVQRAGNVALHDKCSTVYPFPTSGGGNSNKQLKHYSQQENILPLQSLVQYCTLNGSLNWQR